MRLLLQVTGAQGTGKSTLLRELLEDLQERYESRLKVEYVGEVSRTLLSDGKIQRLDVHATVEEQLKITSELMIQYYKAIGTGVDLILAERTPVCCLAYTRLLQARATADITYLEFFTQRFIRATFGRQDIQVYTVYVPPTIPFDHDGVRNQASQLEVDEEIRSILSLEGLPYQTLVTPDLDKRLSILTRTVESFFPAIV